MKRIAINLVVCVLVGSCAHSSELSLHLRASKDAALPGELVEMQVNLVNTGSNAITGIFLLEETAFEVEVLNPNEEPKKYMVPGKLMPEADYKETTLKPGESNSVALRLVYNPVSKEYAINKPGVYQIRAKKEVGYTITGTRNQEQRKLESAAIDLRVSEPTGVDKLVWEELKDPQIAKAFRSPNVRKRSPELEGKLTQLLDRYPDSAYAKQIRELLDGRD